LSRQLWTRISRTKRPHQLSAYCGRARGSVAGGNRRRQPGPDQLHWTRRWREMDSKHRSPVKDQLVETVLFDFHSGGSEAHHRRSAISTARSGRRSYAGTITSATTTTASAGDRGRLKTAALLTGDRWFESGSLQQGVTCELDFGRDATLLNWPETARRPTNTERSGETDPLPSALLRDCNPGKIIGSWSGHLNPTLPTELCDRGVCLAPGDLGQKDPRLRLSGSGNAGSAVISRRIIVSLMWLEA
jgi:hypothetical protein